MNEKSSCPVLRGRDGGNTILLLDHMAVSHDGTETHILNGRFLRSKIQYRNKLQADLNSRINGCAIRQDNDARHTNNQKIHQWSHGSVRFKLTYKAERVGMAVALQDEQYTSRTCPVCGYVGNKCQGRYIAGSS